MLLGITVSVAGISVSAPRVITWLFMALGAVATTCWLKPYLSSPYLGVFFVVSVVSGLLFLISCFSSPISVPLLYLSLLLKLGLAPLHFWTLSLLNSLPLHALILFLGPMKFGFLWLLVDCPSSWF